MSFFPVGLRGHIKAFWKHHSATIHYTVLGTESAFQAGPANHYLMIIKVGCEFLTAARPNRCRFLIGGLLLLLLLQGTAAYSASRVTLTQLCDLVLLSGSLLHLDLCINVLLWLPPLFLSLSPLVVVSTECWWEWSQRRLQGICLVERCHCSDTLVSFGTLCLTGHRKQVLSI